VTHGLEVTIVDAQSGTRTIRSFRKSSVRIGRNPLNDLHVEQPFVSQFHAVIESDGLELVLRDLGSTNGSIVGGQKLSGTSMVLPAAQPAFSVLQLTFQVRVVPLDLVPQSKKRPMAVTGLLSKPPADFMAALRSGMQVDPQEQARLRQQYDAYRSAWATLMNSMQEAALARPQGQRAGFVSQLSADLPAVSMEPDYHRLAADSGCNGITMRNGSAEERIAAEGLREFAMEFMPGVPPPESGDEIVKFLTRLRETLDVFFKAFVPLRDGHRQFRTDLGIPAQPQGRADVVERAATPQELSAALLDSRNSSDGLGYVESTFADMMIHHVAMLNGVMTGVKGLLAELSPDSVKEAAVKSGGREYFGLAGPGPKHYWQEYEKRYGDVAEEEKRLFKLLFGRQFSVAYSQAASENRTSSDRNSRPNLTDPPPGVRPTVDLTPGQHRPPGRS
jgi:type VI secretion system protein ImpI